MTSFDPELSFDEMKYLEDMKALAEDMLILAYVPEADQMSREDALELALQRDLEASQDLLADMMAVEAPSAMG